jgi:hypothetical protein
MMNCMANPCRIIQAHFYSDLSKWHRLASDARPELVNVGTIREFSLSSTSIWLSTVDVALASLSPADSSPDLD